jgi:hypothetical protein
MRLPDETAKVDAPRIQTLGIVCEVATVAALSAALNRFPRVRHLSISARELASARAINERLRHHGSLRYLHLYVAKPSRSVLSCVRGLALESLFLCVDGLPPKTLLELGDCRVSTLSLDLLTARLTAAHFDSLHRAGVLSLRLVRASAGAIAAIAESAHTLRNLTVWDAPLDQVARREMRRQLAERQVSLRFRRNS